MTKNSFTDWLKFFVKFIFVCQFIFFLKNYVLEKYASNYLEHNISFPDCKLKLSEYINIASENINKNTQSFFQFTQEPIQFPQSTQPTPVQSVQPVQPVQQLAPINLMTKSGIKVNHNKKNLIIFKFDEVFTSHPSMTKFENINNFVNLIINSLEPAKNYTEIALILTSGGGNSLYFERAYANLKRLSNHGYKTYALIDSVCASGCYMIACSCDYIIANNHSTIGSIGVYTKRYNGEKLGEKLGVSEIIFKTSDKKGDLPFFGNVDKESLESIQSKINKTMTEFSNIVRKARPKVDIKHLNADVWYSDEALKYNIIDKIQMVDDFIKEKEMTHNIIFAKENEKQNNQNSNFLSSLFGSLANVLDTFYQDIKLNYIY